jgi:hypothetical protein
VVTGSQSLGSLQGQAPVLVSQPAIPFGRRAPAELANAATSRATAERVLISSLDLEATLE